jgi:hypothetical protein
MKQATWNDPEFKQAFLDNERQVRINTGKLACALVVVLMPFGVLLDAAVYPDKVEYCHCLVASPNSVGEKSLRGFGTSHRNVASLLHRFDDFSH